MQVKHLSRQVHPALPESYAAGSVGRHLFTQPKSILLYGPPGTGKTMMAKVPLQRNLLAFGHAASCSIWVWRRHALTLSTLSLYLAPKAMPSFHSVVLLLCFCSITLFIDFGQQELMQAGPRQVCTCIRLGCQAQQHSEQVLWWDK